VSTAAVMADAAYQGEPGAYSEQAAWALVGREAALMPCVSLADVFAAVQTGRARTGVLPIENSLAGTVPRAYELLLQHQLAAAGETLVHIDHVLIGRPGTRLADVRRVLSHPVALDQCRRFIESHGVEATAVFDTAGAVSMVMGDETHTAAAVASRRAAELYGGEVLATGIQDSDENWTRFLLLRVRPAEMPARARKAILTFHLPHESGSLSRALQYVASERLNLTKIESRPIHGRPFEYAFVIELTCADRPDWPRWLEELRSLTTELRWLGAW